MSRISNDSQNSKTYMNYINHFNPDKIIKSNPNSKVAAIFIYTDFLYLYSKEPSYKLKDKFMELAQNHKNSFQKILTKDKPIKLWEHQGEKIKPSKKVVESWKEEQSNKEENVIETNIYGDDDWATPSKEEVVSTEALHNISTPMKNDDSEGGKDGRKT